jgi:hypothetical protein
LLPLSVADLVSYIIDLSRYSESSLKILDRIWNSNNSKRSGRGSSPPKLRLVAARHDDKHLLLRGKLAEIFLHDIHNRAIAVTDKPLRVMHYRWCEVEFDEAK